MPYIKSITNFHTPYVYFYQYVDIYFTKLNTCINYSTKLLFDTGQGNSDLINQIQECSHPSRLLSNLTLTNNLYSVVSRLSLSVLFLWLLFLSIFGGSYCTCSMWVNTFLSLSSIFIFSHSLPSFQLPFRRHQ